MQNMCTAGLNIRRIRVLDSFCHQAQQPHPCHSHTNQGLVQMTLALLPKAQVCNRVTPLTLAAFPNDIGTAGAR